LFYTLSAKTMKAIFEECAGEVLLSFVLSSRPLQD